MPCWLRWLRKPEANSIRRSTVSSQAGLLFRQGVPPHATYLFKHALVQDAAYGTLLREPRRALHARIAETLESQFAEIAENQPEFLARHCTEAGLIEKAAGLWGKAGQRSLDALGADRSRQSSLLAPSTRSRLCLHARSSARADQASSRPYNPAPPRQRLCCAGNQGGGGAGTPADRTSGSAREPPEDPSVVVLGPLSLLDRQTLLRSMATRCCELAAQFLALAEKQGTSRVSNRQSHGSCAPP